MVLGVFVLDETLDGCSGGTDIVGIVHIDIDTFGGLPCHPILDAILKHTIGNDKHLHGSCPEVRMLLIYISK